MYGGGFPDKYMEKENIIAPDLEKIDPTPSIFDLFRQFNQRFFWDKLNMVEVSWSGRQMTSCAGLCSFHPRTGYCSIRLSAPLLSLRPRKDLVETLLHEMIHAFLFMSGNNKDRNDHGPEFHKHMNRINQSAGTNITVYHTFNDEVRHYQSHVWRCNGPCQKVGPFFGFVRRANNRAPGPNDKWWETHRNNCSGIFEKIEEPPGYKSKRKNEKAKNKGSSSDLRNFFVPTKKPVGSNIVTFGDLNTQKNNGRGSLKNDVTSALPVTNKTSTSKTNTKIKGGLDVNRDTRTMATTGIASSSKNVSSSKLVVSLKDQGTVNEHVRNVWANKFSNNSTFQLPKSVEKRKPEEANAKCSKKVITECLNCEELICVSELDAHQRTCSAKKTFPCPVCGAPVLSNCLEEHLSMCLSDSITEDMFGTEDVPIPENNTDSSCDVDHKNQMVVCPICASYIFESKINAHIDECLTLQVLRGEH